MKVSCSDFSSRELRYDIALQERGPKFAGAFVTCWGVQRDELGAAVGEADAGGGLVSMKIRDGHLEIFLRGGIAEMVAADDWRGGMQLVIEGELHGAVVGADGGFHFEDGADEPRLEAEVGIAFGIGAESVEITMFKACLMSGAIAGFVLEEAGVDEAGLAACDGGFDGGEHGGIVSGG